MQKLKLNKKCSLTKIHCPQCLCTASICKWNRVDKNGLDKKQSHIYHLIKKNTDHRHIFKSHMVVMMQMGILGSASPAHQTFLNSPLQTYVQEVFRV